MGRSVEASPRVESEEDAVEIRDIERRALVARVSERGEGADGVAAEVGGRDGAENMAEQQHAVASQHLVLVARVAGEGGGEQPERRAERALAAGAVAAAQRQEGEEQVEDAAHRVGSTDALDD